MKKPIFLTLSMAALLAAGGAYAAQGQVQGQLRPKMDADSNGVITRAEAQAQATSMFARMDVNRDGKIDQADRQLRRETMKTHMFERLDANKDGTLSKAEFLAGRGTGERGGRRQHMAGANSDGVGMHRRGGRGGRMRSGMMGATRLADADKDGAITPAEFSAAALTRFDAMDTNKDGQVTQAERQAARAQMKAQWQQRRNAPTQG
jgi:hypothetical protein